MITPNQIREKKISTVASDGYDRNEVNELLVEVIESYEAVCAENKELYRKMEILANKIEEYREDEDSIKTAIISAQKTARQITTEANETAQQTISQSNASAQQTVQDAKAKADKIIGEARDYVANLTQEKTKIAEDIISQAQEKANNAISSAKLVAKDSLEKAKSLAEEIVSRAKSERELNEEIASKLRNESKEFRATLVSLYEAQLTKLKNLANGSADDGTEDLEKELDAVISNIQALADTDLTQQDSQDAPTEEETAEEIEAEDEINETDSDDEADALIDEIDEDEIEESYDEPEEIEEIEEIEETEDTNDADDEVDEIISEIENSEPEIRLVEEDEEDAPPTEEEVEDAINAFSDDDLTPVEGTGASIPVIEEEPELETLPFETFFIVDRDAGNTDETLSLTAPDEEEDRDDNSSKFKGFLKKRK